MTIKLDYSLETPEERIELVNKIIESIPPSQLTNSYKEILANYIIFAFNKQEKKEKKILTDSRMVTVNKRETSYEGLVDKLENGEDGIYNLMREDKNTLLSPKDSISARDIEELPHLKALVDTIAIIEPMSKAAIGKGKKAFTLKKSVIEMRQDQYVIRNGAHQPMRATSLVKTLARMDLPETVYLDENQEVASNGFINLYNWHHVSALLTFYSDLKQEVWDKMDSDLHYLMMDLDNVIFNSLITNYPLLFDILIMKIDKATNLEIQEYIDQEHGVRHSIEYISSLWRNKIPKLIAEEAKKEWLLYHFTYSLPNNWKTCSRCKENKPSHNMFYSKNKTSKDGFYSICKKCRNAKSKESR